MSKAAKKTKAPEPKAAAEDTREPAPSEDEAPVYKAAPLKLEPLAAALSAQLGGRVRVVLDGAEVVATGTHGDARTPHEGRGPGEIYEPLRAGLAK